MDLGQSPIHHLLHRITPGASGQVQDAALTGRVEPPPLQGQTVWMSHGFPELAAMRRGFFQENGWRVGAVGQVGGIGNHGLQDRGHGLAHFGQVVRSGRIFLRFSSCTPLYSPMDCGKMR